MTPTPTRAPTLAPPAGRARTRAAMVPVDRIRVHPRNVRRTLTGLDELALSIRHQGVLQPLVAHHKYRRGPGVQDLELIAGHRRLAAAEIAGLARVPVFLVATLDDDEAILAMLAENTARAAVPVPDLARAVTALHDEFGYTSAGIAERLGVPLPELHRWLHGHPPLPATTGGASAGRGGGGGGRGRTPRWSPRVRPTQLYQLCQRWETGHLDPAAFAAEVRSWLGDWTPLAAAAAGEPDWAEVEQLLTGHRRAGQASTAACQAAVGRLSGQGLTATQTAARLGLSPRTVVRYRRLARAGDLSQGTTTTTRTGTANGDRTGRTVA